MSFSFSADEFARIRRSLRRVEDDAASRERFADALLLAAEQDVELARATAANPGDVTRACLDRFAVDAQAQLRRSLDALVNMRAPVPGRARAPTGDRPARRRAAPRHRRRRAAG